MPRESDQSLAIRVAGMGRLLQDGPVYGWDLDSTVCSTVHRRHMVEAIRRDAELAGEDAWDRYAMACADDTPIVGSVALMRQLPGTHVAISGRSGCAAELTRAWIKQHDVPLDAVLLRLQGDHTPNGVYKVRVLKALQQAGAYVPLFFEDWGEVAAQVYAETGIPVVGINPFDPVEYEEARKQFGAL